MLVSTQTHDNILFIINAYCKKNSLGNKKNLATHAYFNNSINCIISFYNKGIWQLGKTNFQAQTIVVKMAEHNGSLVAVIWSKIANTKHTKVTQHCYSVF